MAWFGFPNPPSGFPGLSAARGHLWSAPRRAQAAAGPWGTEEGDGWAAAGAPLEPEPEAAPARRKRPGGALPPAIGGGRLWQRGAPRPPWRFPTHESPQLKYPGSHTPFKSGWMAVVDTRPSLFSWCFPPRLGQPCPPLFLFLGFSPPVGSFSASTIGGFSAPDSRVVFTRVTSVLPSRRYGLSHPPLRHFPPSLCPQ